MNITVTFFNNAAAHTKTEQILSIDDLAARIQNTKAASKAELPWVKLARFGTHRSKGNSLRNNENIVAITGIEADYDGGKISIEEAEEILANAGIVAILYPSPSYTSEKPKWRVLCPLSREYSPDQRDRFLARLNGLFGGIFARESWVVSQSYYYGRVANPDHRALIFDGIPIDLAEQLVDGAIGLPKERNVGRPAHPASRPEDITEGRVRGLVRSILGTVRDAADGEKHFALRNACLTLGGYLHLTTWTIDEAVEQAVGALPSADDWDAARDTARWAIEHGMQRPLELEDRPRTNARGIDRGNGHDHNPPPPSPAPHPPHGGGERPPPIGGGAVPMPEDEPPPPPGDANNVPPGDVPAADTALDVPAEITDDPDDAKRHAGNGSAPPDAGLTGQEEPSELPTDADIVAHLAALDDLALERIAKAKAAELGVSKQALIKLVNQARREANAKSKEPKPPPLSGTARQTEIDRLADLKESDPCEYDERRETAATSLGCRVGTLDDVIDTIIEDRRAERLRNKPPPASSSVYDTPEVTALVDEFNANYFVLSEAGRTMIYAPKRDHQLQRDYFERITFPDFLRLYLNRFVKTGVNEKNGEPIYSQAAEIWLRHRNRRQFIRGVVFDPSGRKQDDGVLNLWQGFGVKRQDGSCEKFKQHLLNGICCKNATLNKYVLDWMADVVHHPDKQGEIALVLRGKEGCGKGILGHAMKRLLGQHGIAISNAKHLVGHFNAHLRDTVLLFADEAFYAGDKAHTGILKSLITESDLLIEAKYQNAATAKNYLHIIMASNEQWVVPASLESRRFVVLDVDASHIGDHNYFAAIQHELEHGGYEALLDELLDRDISNVTLRNIPVTDALITQRKLSLDTTEAWWLDCLSRGYVFRSELGLEKHFHEWLNPISTELLYQSYEKYCRARHERHPLSREMLGKWMREPAAGGKHTQPACSMTGEHITNDPSTDRRIAQPVWKDRAPGYSLGTLADARNAFLKATGLTVKWPDEDPDPLSPP